MEALKAATLKLPINKALGFTYLVPYKTKSGMIATCQIGYKGYIQLAMRTGKYRIINADLVYERELRTVDKLTGEIDEYENVEKLHIDDRLRETLSTITGKQI